MKKQARSTTSSGSRVPEIPKIVERAAFAVVALMCVVAAYLVVTRLIEVRRIQAATMKSEGASAPVVQQEGLPPSAMLTDQQVFDIGFEKFKKIMEKHHDQEFSGWLFWLVSTGQLKLTFQNLDNGAAGKAMLIMDQGVEQLALNINFDYLVNLVSDTCVEMLTIHEGMHIKRLLDGDDNPNGFRPVPKLSREEARSTFASEYASYFAEADFVVRFKLQAESATCQIPTSPANAYLKGGVAAFTAAVVELLQEDSTYAEVKDELAAWGAEEQRFYR